MSDHSQSVIFPSVGEQDAASLGGDLLAWLVSEGILIFTPCDCVLSSALGYPPGPNYVAATGMADGNLLQLKTNGAEFSIRRTVFDAGGNGFSLICPSCAARFERLPHWGDAVNDWFCSAGEGQLACPACSVTQTVEEWLYDPPYGFASFGITFWNWPHLTEGFIQALAARTGHCAQVIRASI
ncbi:hypothetical protein [Chitinimonas taiwanensis]|uniref:hypothetical protein n=1 Tax=Chitinimonas taiwanensis TaxID=240412 RepID=UPI0011148F87|nr:hypothetical protein [Chitinimonas taiwanensis]